LELEYTYLKFESDPNPIRKKRFRPEPEFEHEFLIGFEFGYGTI